MRFDLLDLAKRWKPWDRAMTGDTYDLTKSALRN